MVCRASRRGCRRPALRALVTKARRGVGKWHYLMGMRFPTTCNGTRIQC
jgi:hypothetical protein